MNICEFFQESIDALVKWHNIHYDRNTWIDQWVGVHDVTKYYYTSQGVVSNAYFVFNWHAAAYRRWAKDADVTVAELAQSNVSIPTKYLWDSLYEEGFNQFAEGIHQHTDPTKPEVLACLTAVSDAGNPEDQLVAAMWALKIQHANGNIVNDYCQHLTWEDIDNVRRNGIEAVFSRDDVEKFLRGRYPRLEVRGLHV